MIKKGYIEEKKENMRGGEGTVTLQHWIEDGDKCPNLRLAANIVIPKGASIGAHPHNHEAEIFHIVSGTAEYDDNGKIVTAGKGDVLICNDGEEHSIRNAGSDDLVFNAIIIMG
jgi:mannose-6-phosphate isomerase-like protein (cupin superfamily)